MGCGTGPFGFLEAATWCWPREGRRLDARRYVLRETDTLLLHVEFHPVATNLKGRTLHLDRPASRDLVGRVVVRRLVGAQDVLGERHLDATLQIHRPDLPSGEMEGALVTLESEDAAVLEVEVHRRVSHDDRAVLLPVLCVCGPHLPHLPAALFLDPVEILDVLRDAGQDLQFLGDDGPLLLAPGVASDEVGHAAKGEDDETEDEPSDVFSHGRVVFVRKNDTTRAWASKVEVWAVVPGLARAWYRVVAVERHYGCTMVRLIKRYGNRKMYDTQASRYVTLDAVAGLVRAGEDLRIIDNVTGEDLTAVTFAQIILEEAKRRNGVLGLPVLRWIIQQGGEALHEILTGVDRGREALDSVRELAEKRVRQLAHAAEGGTSRRTGGAAKGRGPVSGGRGLLSDILELPQKPLEQLQHRIDAQVRASLERVTTHPAVQAELRRIERSIRGLERQLGRLRRTAPARPTRLKRRVAKGTAPS